jgi:hypothetical protein
LEELACAGSASMAESIIVATPDEYVIIELDGAFIGLE